MARHLRRWGAAYLLLALFLGSWIGQFIAHYFEVLGKAQTHGENFQWNDFWPAFLSATFENWQSEWLQLLIQAVVLLGMKHLLFKADAEDTEVTHQMLRKLLEKHGEDPARIEREVHERMNIR